LKSMWFELSLKVGNIDANSSSSIIHPGFYTFFPVRKGRHTTSIMIPTFSGWVMLCKPQTMEGRLVQQRYIMITLLFALLSRTFRFVKHASPDPIHLLIHHIRLLIQGTQLFQDFVKYLMLLLGCRGGVRLSTTACTHGRLGSSCFDTN
jgi:hypothetical protein